MSDGIESGPVTSAIVSPWITTAAGATPPSVTTRRLRIAESSFIVEGPDYTAGVHRNETNPARLPFLEVAPAFALVVLVHGAPQLGVNEGAYLISVRGALEPEFLQGDWVLGPDSPARRLGTLFGLVLAPIGWLVDDPLALALCARLLIWTLLLVALARLGRALGLLRSSVALGLAAFVFCRQSVGAGEWMFGGAEPKGLAYVFLVLALAEMLRRRLVLSGVHAGLATAFHVLVGAWGGAIVAAAALLAGWIPARRGLLQFAMPALLVASPLLAQAALLLVGSGGSAEGVQILVRVRNPHHLDPGYFLTVERVGFLCLCIAGTLVGARIRLEDGRRDFVTSFTALLAGTWLAGVAAWAVSCDYLLQFYPFRVADVMLPLLFWLFLPELVIAAATAPVRRRVLGLAFVAAVVAVLAWSWERPNPRGPTPQRFVSTWKERRPPPIEPMAAWIVEHTGRQDVFVVPPRMTSFQLRTGRPIVASFKITPGAAGMPEWLHRVELLNGGSSFRSVGTRMFREAGRAHPELPPRVLAELRRCCSARWYLTWHERPDLPRAHSAGGYHLYDLSALPEAPPGALAPPARRGAPDTNDRSPRGRPER
jgi:hypothetical protein